jgi:hypothetical protein
MQIAIRLYFSIVLNSDDLYIYRLKETSSIDNYV